MRTAYDDWQDIALCIPLEGKLGLRDVAQVRQLLSDALSAFKAVEIDLRDLTEVDISIVQLVVAARSSAELFGQSLSLATKSGCAFEATLVKAGFLGTDGVCRNAGERFWAGLVAQEGPAFARAARGHVARLIAEPGQHAADGELILESPQTIVETGIGHVPAPVAKAAAADESAAAARDQSHGQSHGQSHDQSWRITFRLPESALVLGDPLLLLDALRELGSCEVVVSTDAVPPLDTIDPEVCYLGWDVVLTTDRPRQAIDDVFMFVRDGMELSIEPVAPASAVAPLSSVAFVDRRSVLLPGDYASYQIDTSR
jgi:anti-anti-sigma regulatory factor